MANDCYQNVAFYSPVREEIEILRDKLISLYNDKKCWLPYALKDLGLWETEEDFAKLSDDCEDGTTLRGEMVWPPDDNEIWSTTLPDGTLAWYFQTEYCNKWTYITTGFNILIDKIVPNSSIKFVYYAEEPGFAIYDTNDKDHIIFDDTVNVDFGWSKTEEGKDKPEYFSMRNNMYYPQTYKDVPKYLNDVLRDEFNIKDVKPFVPSMFCKPGESIETSFMEYIEEELGGTIEWCNIQPFNYVD